MGEQTATEGTPLASLGEFGLIEHLTRGVEACQPSTRLAIGDDCAAIEPPPGEQLLVSTDLLLEGIHFDLTYFPLQHLGFKAITVNVSDVYAMNGTPTQVVVALGVPARFTVERLEEFYQGVKVACKHYGVDLVGGDTSTSLTGFSISITVLGHAKPVDICRRSGAHPNELICVTGNLGAAYLGLQLLEREKAVVARNPEAQPDFGGFDYLLRRMLRPEARKDAIEAMRRAELRPTSMIDVSDGLSSELLHICKDSGVGCRIYPERIPIDEQAYRLTEQMQLSPYVAALNGGEDYELLLTVPIKEQEKAESLGLTVIGYTTEASRGCVLATKDGDERPLVAQGWQAFRGQNEASE